MPAGLTRKEVEARTLIVPDVLPVHMALLQNVCAYSGYQLWIARSCTSLTAPAENLLFGGNVCAPVRAMLESQLCALADARVDPRRCAFVQMYPAGGCPEDRVGLLRQALCMAQLESVPVLCLQPGRCGGELHISPALLRRCLKAVAYADMLTLLQNQTEPYELHAGEAQRITDGWLRDFRFWLRRGRGLSRSEFQRNLRDMAEDFHRIPARRIPLGCVGVVGRLCLQGAFLQGKPLRCEYRAAPILSLVRCSVQSSRAARRLCGQLGREICRALDGYPEFAAIPMPEQPGTGRPEPEPQLMLQAEALLESGCEKLLWAPSFCCPAEVRAGMDCLRCVLQSHPDADILRGTHLSL